MLRSAAFAKPKSDPLRFLLNNGSLMQSIRLPLWFAEKALSPPRPRRFKPCAHHNFYLLSKTSRYYDMMS